MKLVPLLFGVASVLASIALATPPTISQDVKSSAVAAEISPEEAFGLLTNLFKKVSVPVSNAFKKINQAGAKLSEINSKIKPYATTMKNITANLAVLGQYVGKRPIASTIKNKA